MSFNVCLPRRYIEWITEFGSGQTDKQGDRQTRELLERHAETKTELRQKNEPEPEWHT